MSDGPDYNLAQTSPTGSMLVNRRCVRMEDGHQRLPGDRVDLAPLRGTRMRLARNGAAAVLGTNKHRIRQLERLRVLDRCALPFTGRRRQRLVYLDPAWTLRSIYDRWTAAMPKPRSFRSFHDYGRVRSLCEIPDGDPDPDIVIDGLADRLLEIGSRDEPEDPEAIYRLELGAFLPPGWPERHKSIKDQLIARGVLPSHPGYEDKPDVVPSRGDVLAAFPLLADLPRTALHPRVHGRRREPSPDALARAWAMGPLRAVALLFAYTAAPSLRRSTTLEAHLGNLARLDKHMAAMGIGGGDDAIGQALEGIAFVEGAASPYRPAVRDLICRTWIVVHDAVESYIDSVDEDGAQGLAALLPADHPDREELVARLTAEFGHLRLEGRPRRKRRSDLAADNLPEIENAIELRMAQLIPAFDGLRAAGKALLAARPVKPPKTRGHRPTIGERFKGTYSTVIAKGPVLTPEGRELPGEQETVWRVWRRADFVRSLEGCDSKGHEPGGRVARSLAKRETRKLNAKGDVDAGQVLFEYVGTRLLSGVAAVEPWFVTIARSGVLAAPGRMTWRQCTRRHRYLRDWRLPTLRGTADGLLNFGREDGTLARLAGERNRLIVPVEEFGHAMMFARLGFATVLDNWCRTHEFLQQQYDQDQWPKVAVDKEVDPSFLAIPKVPKNAPTPKPVNFITSTATMMLAFRVARTTIDRLGYDGVLPDVAFGDQGTWKIPDPAPFVFQYGGRIIDHSELDRFLDFLLANIGRWTFHDFRHVGANKGREDGMSAEARRRMLNHESVRHTLWYDRETLRQARRRQTREGIETALRLAREESYAMARLAA